MYICTKQILTPVLGLDTYWGQGGLELWDCHQVDRGIKRDRDLGTKQNWDINFNNQQNVTLLYIKENIAKLSPTSTPTLVEAEVSFNAKSYTLPTHPPTHP